MQLHDDWKMQRRRLTDAAKSGSPMKKSARRLSWNIEGRAQRLLWIKGM
jgi:hypothetical protein